jgi:hypothetical protein
MDTGREFRQWHDESNRAAFEPPFLCVGKVFLMGMTIHEVWVMLDKAMRQGAHPDMRLEVTVEYGKNDMITADFGGAVTETQATNYQAPCITIWAKERSPY